MHINCKIIIRHQSAQFTYNCNKTDTHPRIHSLTWSYGSLAGIMLSQVNYSKCYNGTINLSGLWKQQITKCYLMCQNWHKIINVVFHFVCINNKYFPTIFIYDFFFIVYLYLIFLAKMKETETKKAIQVSQGIHDKSLGPPFILEFLFSHSFIHVSKRFLCRSVAQGMTCKM